MARGDKTGPTGAGPMTGRSAGFCAGFDAPGYANNQAFGFGRGGRGRGNFAPGTGFQYRGQSRGFRWRQAPPVSPAVPPRQTQVEQLKAQAETLQSQLQNLTEQINQLNAE